MEKEKISSRGGARSNAGRPKGSTNSITAAKLLAAIEDKTGKPLEVSLAEGYADSITTKNIKVRQKYEQMFLGKTIADKMQIDVTENEDALEAKRIAFAEALANLASTTKANKDD